jgi:hemerythrin-like domain-containing protein
MMQSRGLLMIEHRLIERMIDHIRVFNESIERTGRVDTHFVDTAVDFIRIYADATHHGKEEDIYFKVLATKEMSEPDRQLMDELVAEHIFGRQTTHDLVMANDAYRNGDESSMAVIADKLKTITGFYPRHIEKEDKVFFPACRRYFSEAEDQALLVDYRQFDQKMIHVKYTQVVEALEGQVA